MRIVFADCLLEVFRQYVNETGNTSGLMFKRWEVSASQVCMLLRRSESELDNVHLDVQFWGIVYGFPQYV